MESTLSRLAVASRRAPGLRSFQILKRHDELRLRAFFLSFDFDQRRAYFAGGMSDSAIREYSERIDWENMTIIARSGPACIDAVVILASLPPTRTTAKLSLACPCPAIKRKSCASSLTWLSTSPRSDSGS